MLFWKAKEPATRWGRLSRNAHDAFDAGVQAGDRARGEIADKLSGVAGAVEPSRRPRPLVLAAAVAAVAVVVFVLRSRTSSSGGTDESSSADEADPTTAVSPGANANGTAATPAGRAAG